MFICLDCGNIFEDPKRWEETHGLDYGPYESYSGCPHCSGAYTETYYCDACGEWITGRYVEIGGDKYCDNCFMISEIGD